MYSDLELWLGSYLEEKSSQLNHTYFRIFQLIKVSKQQLKFHYLWLIVAYLLFAQQVYNWKQQKHGGHVVYVMEQTDQFQEFGKMLAQKNFNKIKETWFKSK